MEYGQTPKQLFLSPHPSKFNKLTEIDLVTQLNIKMKKRSSSIFSETNNEIITANVENFDELNNNNSQLKDEISLDEFNEKTKIEDKYSKYKEFIEIHYNFENLDQFTTIPNFQKA